MKNKILGFVIVLLFAGAGYMTYRSAQPELTVPQTLSTDVYRPPSGVTATKTSQSSDGSGSSELIHKLEFELTQLSDRHKSTMLKLDELLSLDSGAISYPTNEDDLEGAMSTLRSRFTALMSERQELSNRLSELESRNRALQGEVTTMRDQYERRISKLNESHREHIAGLENERSKSSKNAEDALREAALVNQRLQESEQSLMIEQQNLTQLRQDLDELKRSMSLEINEKDIKIKQIQDSSAMIQLANDVVFSTGSAVLSAQGKEILRKVTEIIGDYPDYIVSLEGHTDNVPIGPVNIERYPSNWELSAARAASAARYLVDQGVDPVSLKVSGYGANRPVSDNQSETGRARNRRLEILFSPQPRIQLRQ